jgi:DNA-binding transcriptional LysR family regulator
MELHHLRHFVAVAEQLHFGRAAEQLGMSQPPLSQSIQRFETSLGFALFDRIRGKVSLTAAGRALLPHARDILAQVELAERVARQASEGCFDSLRIGFVPWSLTRALPRAIRSFKKRWSGVQVLLYERVSRQQVDSLREGELSIAIVNLHLADVAGLQSVVVEHSELVVAVPQAWPLAAQAGVRLADLASQPFVGFPQRLSPGSHDALLSACLQAGFRPNVIQETVQPFSMLNMVANEVGIALVQNTAAEMRIEGVRFLPVIDAPSSFKAEVALVWNPGALTPPLSDFLDTVQQQCALLRGDAGTAA